MPIWYFTPENEEILWTQGFGKSPLELNDSTLYVIPIVFSLQQIETIVKLKVVQPEPLEQTAGQALNDNFNLLTRHILGSDDQHTVRINVKTSNDTLLDTQTDEVFVNKGAGGTVILNLPVASVGLRYTFIVEANQTLRINATNGANIRVSSSPSFVNGRIETDVVGSVVRLLAVSETEWFAISSINVWTVT